MWDLDYARSMISSIILLILAAFALVVGGLAWSGRLPGNSIIGLKVKEVRTSREIWNAAHAAAGPLWVFAGLVLLFGGLLAARIDGALSWAIFALSLIFALVLAGAGANMGARMAAAVAPEEESGSCDSDSCGCGSGGCDSETPEVDVEALRAAMRAGEEG